MSAQMEGISGSGFKDGSILRDANKASQNQVDFWSCEQELISTAPDDWTPATSSPVISPVAPTPPIAALATAAGVAPRMSDPEVDMLAAQMDEQCQALQKGVLDYFIGVKSKMLSSQAAAVDMERKLAATKLAAKQAEVDSLDEQLSTTCSRVAKLEDITSRCVAAYSDSSYKARAMQQMVYAWVMWRKAVKEAREQRHKMSTAVRWHKEVMLKRNVFAAWRKCCLCNQRELAQKRADVQVAAARAQLAAEKDAVIAELRRQLEHTQQQLMAEGAAREQLEEDMRRAFMRGVCALNIEAMTVMKRGGMGSINPAAVPFSSAPEPAADHQTTATASGPAPSTYPTMQQQYQQQHTAGSSIAPNPTPSAYTDSSRIATQLSFSADLAPHSTPQPASAALQAAAAATAAAQALGAQLQLQRPITSPARQQQQQQATVPSSSEVNLHPVLGYSSTCGSTASTPAQPAYAAAAPWVPPGSGNSSGMVAARPRVVIERGPWAAGGAGLQADILPRPRSSAPAPQARAHYGAK